MSLKYRSPSVALIFIHLCIFPAKADVWKYVDKNGALQFSNSRPAASAERIMDSGRVNSSNPENFDVTNCPSPCKRPTPDWWHTSPKYLALQEHLTKAAQASGVEQELLTAIAATESAFNPDAISRKGAVGVMQVMPATARMYGVQGTYAKDVTQELKKPATNIDVAARHLSRLLGVYGGQLELALAAYNAGELAVARASNRVPNYTETRQYVSNVMYLYQSSKARLR